MNRALNRFIIEHTKFCNYGNKKTNVKKKTPHQAPATNRDKFLSVRTVPFYSSYLAGRASFYSSISLTMTPGFFSHYFSQKQKLESNSLFLGGPHQKKVKIKKNSKASPSLLFNFLSSILLSFPFRYGLPSNNLPGQFSRSPFLSLLFPFPSPLLSFPAAFTAGNIGVVATHLSHQASSSSDLHLSTVFLSPTNSATETPGNNSNRQPRVAAMKVFHAAYSSSSSISL